MDLYTKIVILSLNVNVNDIKFGKLTENLLLIITIFTYNRLRLAKN